MLRAQEVPLERFAKYDGPSDSDAWLTEAIEEAGKKEGGSSWLGGCGDGHGGRWAH